MAETLVAQLAHWFVRGESRRPDGFWNTGSSSFPEDLPRRSRSIASSATFACADSGTMRSLSPLPITRSVRALQSTSERSSPSASESRSPEP